MAEWTCHSLAAPALCKVYTSAQTQKLLWSAKARLQPRQNEWQGTEEDGLVPDKRAQVETFGSGG